MPAILVSRAKSKRVSGAICTGPAFAPAPRIADLKLSRFLLFGGGAQ